MNELFEIDLLRARLRALFYEFGIETSDDQELSLLKHLRLLFEKNRVLNLTRITSMDDALVKHVLDSVLFSQVFNNHLSSNEEYRFIDIGTGGGFPGIPFAVMQTQTYGVLNDSVSKKICAVSNFINELKLNDRITVSDLRCEDIARVNYESFDLVLARAVAPLAVLLEYASPLLCMGGYAIFSKAIPQESEVLDAFKVAKLCGFSLIHTESFILPNDNGPRTFFIYRKVFEPQVKLPRKNGAALKKPLALR